MSGAPDPFPQTVPRDSRSAPPQSRPLQPWRAPQDPLEPMVAPPHPAPLFRAPGAPDAGPPDDDDNDDAGHPDPLGGPPLGGPPPPHQQQQHQPQQGSYLPPPPPNPLAHAAALAAPAAAGTGVKVAKPDYFTGKPTEVEPWLHQCNLYIENNLMISECQKIIFRLSYMKGGNTGLWGEKVLASLRAINWAGATWPRFEVAIKRSFGDID
jgi:hypothetical protein